MFATAADDAVSLTETEIESLTDVDTSRLQAFTARFCSFYNFVLKTTQLNFVYTYRWTGYPLVEVLESPVLVPACQCEGPPPHLMGRIGTRVHVSAIFKRLTLR